MNLLSVLLKTLLDEKTLKALMQKTGLTADKLKVLIPKALPLLLKFLTGNASTQSGALSLLGALGQHSTTKALPEQIAEADETDGGKIVNHILGGEKETALEDLSKETGLSTVEVNKALGSMAPALLASLNTATQTAAKKVDLSDGLDLSELMILLGGAQKGGLLKGLLGGLFGGRKEEAAEKDDKLNGNALLTSLLALMK